MDTNTLKSIGNGKITKSLKKNKKAKNDWYIYEAELKQNRLQVYWIHHKDSAQKYMQKILTKENIY